MEKLLHALVLDDSQNDALLLLHELRRGGFEVEHVLVDNEIDFRAALEERRWDIILSDYSMPSFDAPGALKITRDRGFDIPFIVISGTVGEDAAVAVMKAGASDFFAKNNLKRLIPSVERELRDAEQRYKRIEAESRFATVFQRSPIGTVISRLSDGVVLDVNDRFLEDYHFTRDELVGKSGVLPKWINPEQRQLIDHILAQGNSIQGIEIEYTGGDDKNGFALLSAEITEVNNERCVLSMVQDITEHKNAETTLRASEEKFRLLAENSTDMISRHTPEGVYLYVSPACQMLLGYTPEELVGHSAYDYFHPDDVAAITDFHQSVLTAPDIYTITYRIRHKQGTYSWFETTCHTIRDSEGSVVEIHTASRDITERKTTEDANIRYAQRLELLHDIDRAILQGERTDDMVNSVLRRLQPLTGFDSASVTTFDAEFREFMVQASIVPIPNYYPYDDMSIIDLLKHGEVYPIDDLRSLTNRSPSDQALLNAGYRSYVRVPLIANNKLVGSFHLRGQKPNTFSLEAIIIAKEVGAQLAIAIENARLLEIEQRRTSELSALHGASLQLTSSLDMEHVLNTIIDYARSLIGAHDAHIFLYDGNMLSFGTALWQGKKRDTPFSEPRQEGITYNVARSGKRIIISNVDTHPLFKDWRWGGAIIALPLRIGNWVVGVMSLGYQKPHDFDEHEIRVLELLADQAAIAIHNAQLYEQIQNHASELEQRVKERTSELQASEAKYRSLIEFAPDPIVLIDAEGKIALTNRRAEAFFGYEQLELIGQPVERLIPERLHDQHKAQRERYGSAPYHRTMDANFTLIAQHKDGTEIPVKIGLSPIDTGTEILIMAYIVDITADKQLEESLRAALAKEKDLNELKTSFTSIVSHEFRTPLSVILSSTDLLISYGERMSPIRRQEKLSNITRQVQRLIQLLDDVLLITRSETTGFVYKPMTLNLVTLSEELLEEIRVGYRQDVSIEFVAEGQCKDARADEFLFSHILQNLASNAMKYSQAGGSVHVRLSCTANDITLRIQDQGIGIPEADQQRLFEAFRRAANVGQIKGTGIGLSIVKRAVEAWGGMIEFESAEGQGTTFIVTLPTSQLEAHEMLSSEQDF